MAKKDPQQMLSDKNFRFFQKSELNLDLAEIQISFNDLVILKGLQMKFDLMNKEFERHMESLQPQEKGSSEDSLISRKPSLTPSKVSKSLPNISRPKKNKIEYIPEDCEVNIDSDEDIETESQLRMNISLKQEKELLMANA